MFFKGGLSSYIIVEPESNWAVVILTDTHQCLGMEEVAIHLLHPDEYTPPPPRHVRGGGSRSNTSAIVSSRRGGIGSKSDSVDQTLIATLGEGTTIEFGFDTRGDFYQLSLDTVLLKPIVDEAGKQTLIWIDDTVIVAELLDL